MFVHVIEHLGEDVELSAVADESALQGETEGRHPWVCISDNIRPTVVPVVQLNINTTIKETPLPIGLNLQEIRYFFLA